MPRRRPASGRRTASWASRSPARRSASSAAAISARSSPTAAHGLRMKVIAYDPFLSPERATQIWRSRRSSLPNCSSAPISSRCTRRSPTRPGTSSMPRRSPRMKKGVRIINCARGGLVDEAALRDALNSGQVAGAAFDVFVEEPATTNPLFGHPERGLHAASGRLHHGGAGECGAAGRRTDVGLSAQRRDLQRGQLSLDLGRGGAAAASRSWRLPRSSAHSPASSPRRASARCRSPMRARWRR